VTPDRIAVLAAAVLAVAGIWRWFFRAPARTPGALAALAGGAQLLDVRVEDGYDPATIRVRSGTPVRLTFTRTNANSCTEEVVLGDFGVRAFLPTGVPTVVAFTPDRPGRYDFHCGMGMVHGTLIVEGGTGNG
jgi:Cu+-exporting ATPase